MFVDNCYDFTYGHLMYKLDVEATVEANMMFERICYSYGVTVFLYHENNCLFDTKKFKEALNT